MPDRIFVLLTALLITTAAIANDLAVDRRTVRAGESVTITVSLENEFAGVDDVRLPVRNLTIGDAPSVSSEFSWINGSVVRRKVFRFRARAEMAGAALVGPVIIVAGNGRRETLPSIPLQVLPDRASVSNDPATVLRELLAAGRDPFFVVAEADKTSAFVGEQVSVTWWLYNAATVQQWQVGAIPKLNDFWVEELDVRSSQPFQVFVGNFAMQKVPIRRVALYPLRSGHLDIGPTEVEAAVMHQTNTGGFGFFEGSVSDVTFASAHLAVDAQPLPPGPPVAAIGDLQLRCSPPLQKGGGPVSFGVALGGRGNLRAATRPVFASTPDADVQVIEEGVTVEKNRESPVATRRWRYLLFPQRAGVLTVPALEIVVFSPAAQTRQTLRCEATTLTATASAQDERATATAQRTTRPMRLWPIAIAIAGVAVLLLLGRWLRSRMALRREVRQLLRNEDVAAIRDAVNGRLQERGLDPTALLRETSERGDAYRSLRSLLDALEKDRIEVENPDREVRRRIRDLLVALSSRAA